MMAYFWQLAINPKLKTQNSVISFGYVDSYVKIFLMFYPLFENSTNHIAITVRKQLLCVLILSEIPTYWLVLTLPSS